eukprot:271928_1
MIYRIVPVSRRLLESIGYRHHFIRTKNKPSSKQKNQFQHDIINQRIQKEKQKRISGTQQFIEGSKEFANYRSKIFKSASVKEIHRILNSRTDFDASVYNAAIQKSGKLRNIDYCINIMDLMVQHTKPDIYTFNQLFQAFRINDRADCDGYMNKMINFYNIQPNIITAATLLGQCTKTGNIQRAEKIWKDIILHFRLKPHKQTYLAMIQIYGQTGAPGKAAQFYDMMSKNGVEVDEHIQSAMLNAYIRNNQIENALALKTDIEKKGNVLDYVCYVPLISFYLKDSTDLNPIKSLQLVDECIKKNQLNQVPDRIVNLKFVAYKKLLSIEKDKSKKSVYFALVNKQPNVRVLNGLSEWDRETARNVLDAHLIYYNKNFNSPQLIACFEHVCKYIGYWIVDGKTNKWILDLHGYNYDQAEFALHHILTKKTDEVIGTMGFEWEILCGRQRSSVPSSKSSQTGIKQFIMDQLNRSFKIRSNVDFENDGKLKLNSVDVKKHLESLQSTCIDK